MLLPSAIRKHITWFDLTEERGYAETAVKWGVRLQLAERLKAVLLVEHVMCHFVNVDVSYSTMRGTDKLNCNIQEYFHCVFSPIYSD